MPGSNLIRCEETSFDRQLTGTPCFRHSRRGTMTRTVQVFVIPKERVPAGPPDPAKEIQVEGKSIDGLRAETRRRLEVEGYRVRAISCTADGLIAYVEGAT